MKKFLTPFCAGLLAAALATTSFAMTRGTVVVKDKYYDDEITTALPGQTVYIGLCTVGSSKETPTKAYLFDAETLNSDTGKDDKLFGSKANKPYSKKGTAGESLDIVKKEVEDGEYYYFAVLEIKEVKDFPPDGYDVFPGTIRVTRRNNETFDVTPDLHSIGFEEGDDELEEDLLGFSFDKGDDVEINFPDGGGYIYGAARKKGTIVASMSTEEISSIARRYPDADLRFFLGNGASLTDLRSPKLFFEGSEDDYLYEVTGTNTLTNRTKDYDDDEGGFVVSTNTLGKYVVSDTRLSSSASSSSSRDDDDDDDDDDEVVYPSGNQPAYVVPINPTTGARA